MNVVSSSISFGSRFKTDAITCFNLSNSMKTALLSLDSKESACGFFGKGTLVLLHLDHIPYFLVNLLFLKCQALENGIFDFITFRAAVCLNNQPV